MGLLGSTRLLIKGLECLPEKIAVKKIIEVGGNPISSTSFPDANANTAEVDRGCVRQMKIKIFTFITNKG